VSRVTSVDFPGDSTPRRALPNYL